MSKNNSLICKTCGKRTLHTKGSINHILHLLLSIITGGLWIIVWVIIAIFFSDDTWRCTICGKSASFSNCGIAGNVLRSFEQNKLERNKCPYCAELIKPEAIVCRYCGTSLKNKYIVTGLDKEGMERTLVLDADSTKEAAHIARDQGLKPFDIQLKKWDKWGKFI